MAAIPLSNSMACGSGSTIFFVCLFSILFSQIYLAQCCLHHKNCSPKRVGHWTWGNILHVIDMEIGKISIKSDKKTCPHIVTDDLANEMRDKSMHGLKDKAFPLQWSKKNVYRHSCLVLVVITLVSLCLCRNTREKTWLGLKSKATPSNELP